MATNWEELLFAKMEQVHNDVSLNAQKTAAIEQQLKSVIGNGQPGRLGKVEEAVEQIKAWKNQKIGEQRAERRRMVKLSISATSLVLIGFKILEHYWK